MSVKLFGVLGGAAACCAAIILLLGGGKVGQVVTQAVKPTPDPDPGRTVTPHGVHFYNDDLQLDGNSENDHNFGPSAYQDVTSGKYPNLYDELLDRMDYTGEDDPKGADPNLMAAVAYATDLSRGTNILDESHDSNLKLGERPNIAAERLLNSEKDRKVTYDKLKEQFEQAEITIEELGDYTSQQYQLPTGTYFEDRPAITVDDTPFNGGHVLIFRWEDGTMLKLRLECGYQPVDTPEWNPPTDKHNPPSKTTTPPTTTPPTETTPPPVESKDAKEAPIVYDDPDIGGYVRRNDINTSLQSEPSIEDLPTSYDVPSRPTITTQAAVEETRPQVTQAPVVTAPPQVTYDGKVYTDAPPQVTQPPLQDVNDNAPGANGVDGGIQTGTLPAGDLYW